MVTFFLLCNLVLFVIAAMSYSGSKTSYTIFSAVSITLLLNGLIRNPLFFDTFIGFLSWLGFWFKFTVQVLIGDTNYERALYFDGSIAQLDYALIVATVGLSGFLLSSIARRFWFVYPKFLNNDNEQGFLRFYKHNRAVVLIVFVMITILVAGANFFLGIYQRGMVPVTVLPFGLNGIVKWLLLFGLASFSALIIHFEINLSKSPSWAASFTVLFELLMSNLSLLSRGFIVNGSSLAIGYLRQLLRLNRRIFTARNLTLCSVFVLLFIFSVVIVNYLRAGAYHVPDPTRSLTHELRVEGASKMTELIWLDRWVGIEAVVAVSSRHDLGWEVLRSALAETPDGLEIGYYDKHFIDSPYKHMTPEMRSTHNHISLPGLLAFCFYLGSLPVLFLSLFIFGILAAFLEIFVFYMGGKNLVLCALLSQVVSYRYAHFGFSPQQSYLLFGALLLNVLIMYVADRCCRHFQDNKI